MGVIFLEPWARQFYADLPPLPTISRRNVMVLGVSKLTCDPVGVEIWIDLCSLIQEITGKRHVHKEEPLAWFRNDPEEFILPEGQVEGFMHEFCHWVIASPDERLKKNLGLGKFREDFTKEDGLRNEERVWALEAWLFSPYITELELAKHISPEANIRSASRWINNPLENLSYGLARAFEIGLPVDSLRSVLERWVLWLKQTLIDSAKAESGSNGQATKCAVCLVYKHTPVRNDRLGGYVCAGCLEKAYEDAVEALESKPSGDGWVSIQGRIRAWVESRLGPQAMHPHERGLRQQEESFELGQALGVTREESQRLLLHVYSKPLGDPQQELGGSALTLLGCAEGCGLDLMELALRELERIEVLPPEKFQKRQALNVELGIGLSSPTPAPEGGSDGSK